MLDQNQDLRHRFGDTLRKGESARGESQADTGNGRHGPSTANLINQAASQISSLVRDELALAKAELSAKAKRAGVGAGLLGATAVMGWFAFGLLLTLGVVLIHLALPLWASVLIVLGAVVVIMLILAVAGISSLRSSKPAPTEAVQNVRADVDVVRDAFQDGRHHNGNGHRPASANNRRPAYGEERSDIESELRGRYR